MIWASGGCTSSNPLQSECSRQADCAKDNQWVFSESECNEQADYSWEKAKSAACTNVLKEYAECVDSLKLACDDNVEKEAAEECKKEAKEFSECMADSLEDEAKERNGASNSSGGATSSSGGSSGTNTSSSSSSSSSSSGSTSNGSVDDYCDKIAECSNGGQTAETCKSSQAAAVESAETAGCSNELNDFLDCASALSCTDLPNYQTECSSSFEAYQAACGT